MSKHILRVRTCLTLTLAALIASLTGCDTGAIRPDNALNMTGGFSNQDVVAVLLPKSGRYSDAAREVRDGILAAQSVETLAHRPQVRFYDSSDPASVLGLLQQAAADGATLAIGPLQKASVSALSVPAALPIPTLALNRVTMDAIPKNLFQFALSPEDEAVDAANKAWEKGYRKALMLYPDGRWGERISGGFRRRWSALGGQLVSERNYASGAEDYSETVSGLFSQPEGTGRADFVFLVTTAQTARILWPQIQASGWAGLPVYATSHIYGGSFDPDDDRALVGMQFVDIPWLLEPDSSDPLSRERLQSSLPGAKGSFTRLYAMGIDAYNLVPRLTWMAKRPGAYMDGRTGRLSLDTRRQIRRELTLARMDIVGPVRITATDREPRPVIETDSSKPTGAARIASVRP